MKKIVILYIVSFFCGVALLTSCKKEIGNLNNPVIEDYLNNATKPQLDNLVIGTESGMRNNMELYLEVVGVIGREMYRFSGSDPRYVTDLLGQGTEKVLDNNAFYLTNNWNARYRVVKNCNLIIQATNTTNADIPAATKKGYLGFAKTIKAHQLLLNLNLTYTNGIRLQVEDPDNPGAFLGYPESLTAIASLLDEAKTDLTGATIGFALSTGFDGFKDAAGLIKFNRALAARVAVYRQQWAAALTALNESFFDLNGSFNLGVHMVYSTGPNDQLNAAYFPKNRGGEVRVAHPSYVTDILPGDDRIGKATVRTSTASSSDGSLSSNRDVWVYTSSTAPVPVIRNEELILIYAEAKINLTQIPDGIVALNRIRTGHNLPVYAGGITVAALTAEMLYQRRYSLFFEGHRWVDMRRYDRLNQLPIDRAGDDVWDKFPKPLTEN
ncbi:RagB/SusD family nutrient uptake outer membrane protein [Pseudoflavitalea sp. X16]|uniref:RagB/SusD family nutrient uptake outer membrane protein n=1 Tax=Paraflavitalea devenefica TaxID=2716334 RepID=UPI00141F02A9|nr:RagB/SusD family nutrient uptake outer membrane protein [Paraflavitalea devenefica]NII23736.1 RagB/SusD family nutrient uptake outer membrane protein [Paraflavitalea devenefica]